MFILDYSTRYQAIGHRAIGVSVHLGPAPNNGPRPACQKTAKRHDYCTPLCIMEEVLLQ